RAMNAKLARYGGLREPAVHEGVTLATFFVGQMVIAFGHMSSVRCGVPREDSLHLAVRDPACTTWKSVAGEKDGLKGARYGRVGVGIAPPRLSQNRTCGPASGSLDRYVRTPAIAGPIPAAGWGRSTRV